MVIIEDMPELPEAECVRRTLEPDLLGRKVHGVDISLAKIARPSPHAFTRGLTGRTIAETGRHGKMIILHLDDGSFWTIHLGMTGQVIMARQRPDAKHIHVTVGFTDKGPSLHYRDIRQFGHLDWSPDRESLMKGPLANFGTDALLIGKDEFVEKLKNRTAPIKSLILDQRILAGVGNIYADESLHKAGINPHARPSDLAENHLARLHGEIVDTLRDAIEKGGSSVRNFVDARGRAGTFQHEHRVYQRKGLPCPHCGETVEKCVLGGRSTHFCPNCQPE